MFNFTTDGVVSLSTDANTAITNLGSSLTEVWSGSDILTAFTTIAPLLVLGIVTGLVIGIVMHQIKRAKNKLGKAN